MNDNDVAKFNITIDGENPEAQFKEDIEESQAVRLNRRITRTAFLVIALMGVVVLFVYKDLRKNLLQMSSSGNSEIQTLSKGVETKLSSLSLRQTKLEDLLTKKVEPLEQAIGSMQTSLKELATAIKQIRSARDNDNKKTADNLEAIHRALPPVMAKIEHLAVDIDRFKQKQAAELSSLSRMTTSIQGHLETMEKDLQALASSTLDENTLEGRLANERNIYQKRLAQFQRDLENRFDDIEARIKALEHAKYSMKRQLPTKPKAVPAAQARQPNPVDANVENHAGTIIEQDILHHEHEKTAADPE
jgi:chromosome segregation ATPase